MTETAGAPAADPWGVVPQRLCPPAIRSDALDRTALVARLLAAGRPCVVVRAGAGYGKTILLRQWVDVDGRAVAWVSHDPSDNDPVVLARHLVRSLRDAGLDLAAAEDLLASREPQFTNELLPALARGLEAPERAFILVLDDVHEVTAGPSAALLDSMVDLVPPGSVVALCGRSMPSLRLARRRVDDTVLELGQDDLAFTDREASSLVDQLLPDVPQELTDRLCRRTERWPAGLYLGMLAVRDHPDPRVFMEGLLATDRRVAEYFNEEVLDHQTPEVRDFLTRAAVLDRLSGDLCDAVLERDDSRSVLEQLVASGNLFVVPVQGAPDAFRFHHLFAELLVSELRRSDPAVEPAIRRRAASWHDERGESDPAVRQALATEDPDFAAEVLYRQLFPAMLRGEVASLARWIGDFPPDQVRSNGLVALVAGWLAVATGNQVELDYHLSTARAASFTGTMPDGTVTYEVALAALEMTAGLGGVKATASAASTVREAGPQGSPWFGMASLLEAVSLGLAGLTDRVSALEQAEIESRGMLAVHVVALAQLGVAVLQAGDRGRGQSLVRDAMDELHRHRLEHYSLAVIVHCAASYAAAVRGDAVASARSADDADVVIRSIEHVVPRAQIQARLLLADAALRRDDADTATSELRAATAVLCEEPDAVVLHDWADELDQRLARVRVHPGAVGLTAAELRVLEQLPTHRSLVEIGDHLYVSRNTVKTHTLSIYRKLYVSGRSEAVDRARELGLLDGAPGAPG